MNGGEAVGEVVAGKTVVAVGKVVVVGKLIAVTKAIVVVGEAVAVAEAIVEAVGLLPCPLLWSPVPGTTLNLAYADLTPLDIFTF